MGFGILILGFVFILFDININAINLLPNVIGWIIVLIGMNAVCSKIENNFFKKGELVTFFIIILSAFETVTHYVDFFAMIMYPSNLLEKSSLLLFQVIYIGTVIYFMYLLCKGIEEEAKNRGNYELVGKSTWVFKVYAIIQIFSALPTVFAIVFMNESTINFTLGSEGILFIIFGFAIMFYFAYILFRMLNEANKTFS